MNKFKKTKVNTLHNFKFDNLSFVPCIVLGLESFGGLFIPFLGSVEQCCRRIEFETDDLKNMQN